VNNSHLFVFLHKQFVLLTIKFLQMKKVLFLGLSLLGLISVSHAQSIQFGLKGGVNFANYTGGNVENVDFKVISNLHFGALLEIELFDNLSLQPELLYSSNGAEIRNVGDDFKNELGYLALPVLAKFYLTSEKLSLEAGPQFSVLVSERNEVDANDTNTFDFGLAGGLSYKITKNIFVSGRYIAGLTEVKKDADVKNSVIQFSVGIMF